MAAGWVRGSSCVLSHEHGTGAGATAQPEKKEVKIDGDETAADAVTAAAKAEIPSEKSVEISKASEANVHGRKDDVKPVEKRKRQYRIATDLLRAFRYFDTTGA